MKTTASRMLAATALVGAGVATAVAGSLIRQTERALPEPGLVHAPQTLRETGLYAGDAIDASNEAFAPQYPLWTDGAEKQRWIYLPPGTQIDASDPDAWQFPVGTKLWKEFSFGGVPVETRFMVRTRDGWEFATYVWAGGEAVRTPDGASTIELAAGVRHRVPSEGECRACHGNGSSPVLGFSALQLSIDRDPNAPHSQAAQLDLASLVMTGRIRGVTNIAPRIPGAPVERAALGYLHGNCGHCHRREGAVESVGMVLSQSLVEPGRVERTIVGQPSRFMAPALRVQPGASKLSVVIARMRSRNPLTQMPPLGTQLVDDEATHLIATWIDQLATN
ncbi:MAG TPA: hypothetical protein VMZ53_17770 [Kofleriaceae bacterium]|nr:hypothetical protein [Kofleriaceae bacterium]